MSAAIYDVVRIDHFRGFAGYYAIPADSRDARPRTLAAGAGAFAVHARWRKRWAGAASLPRTWVFSTEDVHTLLRDTGYPGMKVMEFAFDSRDGGEYLPPHLSPQLCSLLGHSRQ